MRNSSSIINQYKRLHIYKWINYFEYDLHVCVLKLNFIWLYFHLFCLFLFCFVYFELWTIQMKAKIQEKITRDWNSERYCFCYCCCSETFAHRHRIKFFIFVCSRNAPYFTLMHLKLLVEYKSNNSNKCNLKMNYMER